MHRMGHASSAAALRYQHATQERDIEVARRLDEFVAQRTPNGENSSGGTANRNRRDGSPNLPAGPDAASLSETP